MTAATGPSPRGRKRPRTGRARCVTLAEHRHLRDILTCITIKIGIGMLEAWTAPSDERPSWPSSPDSDPVVPGTISQRSTRCAGVGCHCRADPPVLHGPYPTWTHQQDGRQVTKTLSARGGTHDYGPAIAANRRLHELVKELEALSVAEFESARGK